MTTSPGRSEAEREEMVEALAKALGDIRVEQARQADWWTNDEDHALLAQVLRGECVPWAEGLFPLIARIEQAAEARALREFADAWAERPETSSAEMYADACARADRLEDR